MKDRSLVSILRQRLAEPEPLIQVVVGPRQVGKTTALQSALDGRGVYQSADYPTPTSPECIADWWHDAESTSSRILAIDEIQKIPDWSSALKQMWDQSQDMKVVVTGSSSLQLEKGLRETLAGRFELIRAEHWNWSESERVFGKRLEEFIEFGCYPGSMRFLEDRARWGRYIRDAIVEPALGRDLLQLHPVENPALLRQVFGAAVSLPAQTVSLQKIQRSLHEKGSIPTLGHYLELLAGAFLVTGVQKYSASMLRAKKSIPKLIIHDNSLIRAFERPIETELSPERFGRYFENAIGARLLEAGWDVFYWKERDLEVDFVVMGPQGEHWAIEVKTTPTDERALKGLFEFCRRYPDFEPCLVCLAEHDELPGVRILNSKTLLSLEG